MDLTIAGMALSYQWWPSLDHFLVSLPDASRSSPALVEHFGQVILEAVRDAGLPPEARLSIIRDLDQADLGYYLADLQENFESVAEVGPASAGLSARISQAADLIQAERDHHVVICDLSRFGSAAVVLSPPQNPIGGYSRLRSEPDLAGDPSRADYVILAESLKAIPDLVLKLLDPVFRDRDSQHPVALGISPAASLLNSELVSLLHAALAVRHRIIPPSGFKDLGGTTDPPPEPLSTNQVMRPWLARGGEFKRSALLLLSEPAGGAKMFALEELERAAIPPAVRHRPGVDPLLFPIAGPGQEGLLSGLADLEGLLQGQDSLKTIANNVYAQFKPGQDPFVCVLLARDREDLARELAHAKSGIRQAFQSSQTWTSPAGSYFTPRPLGKAGVAFVYPGAFNSYPGMARELFFSFPNLDLAAGELIPDLSYSLAEEFLYLKSSRPGGAAQEQEIMADFYRHPTQLIESGISLSALHTLLLDRIFDLKPQAALGYSLGEISMLWANQVWRNAQDSSDTWKESSLFKHELVGEMTAVRSHWNDLDLPPDFWSSYILKADRERVREACQSEPLAFLTIENTPTEVVIAGESSACQRVIQSLDCRSLPMPFNEAIHNPTISSTYPAFLELYRNPTHPRSDIRFFSAADYQELTLSEGALADAMARMTISPVDFPRLVEKVYSTGVQIFIEVGPQKTCSRWIERILEGRPHAVIPINKKYQSDLAGVLKVISLLVSHGVAVNLQPLFSETSPSPPSPGVKAAHAAPAGKPADPHPPREPGSGPPVRIPGDQPGLPAADIYLNHLDRFSASLAQSHQEYLHTQSVLARNLARMMQLQAGSPAGELILENRPDALYSREQIQAFTTGDHRVCFGSTFSGFGERRIPRLPNGPLQFIDRVVALDGKGEIVQEGSSLLSEYDLPGQSWFNAGTGSHLPHVSLLEIALQPCGFLSAFMGTIKGRESQDLYFRNLDGEGTLLSWPLNPAGTITNQVKLLSSSSLQDVIIQTYEFQLAWEGEPFYQGTSSFGYFPLPMLLNQAGLDGSQVRTNWYQENPTSGEWHSPASKPRQANRNGQPHLPEIDRLWISLQGGKYSRGYIYLSQQLSAQEWFYQAHFYQDPVMPGSLGVETMAQAIMAGADAWGVPSGLRWRVMPGVRTSWKYRGQITPESDGFQVELHIKDISRSSTGYQLIADGQLWKGVKPIYLVEGLALESF